MSPRPVTLEGHKERTKNAGHSNVSDLRWRRFIPVQKTRQYMDCAASFHITCGRSQCATWSSVPVGTCGEMFIPTETEKKNRKKRYFLLHHDFYGLYS